jgi:hypothetical protein
MTSSEYDEKSGRISQAVLSQNEGPWTTMGVSYTYSKGVIIDRTKEILLELKKAPKPETRFFTYEVALLKALESGVRQIAILEWDLTFRWCLQSPASGYAGNQGRAREVRPHAPIGRCHAGFEGQMSPCESERSLIYPTRKVGRATRSGMMSEFSPQHTVRTTDL